MSRYLNIRLTEAIEMPYPLFRSVLDHEHRSMNEPDRGDWYLMQLSAIVSSLFSSRMKNPKHFKLTFQSDQDSKPSSPEELSRNAKAVWLARTSKKGIRS